MLKKADKLTRPICAGVIATAGAKLPPLPPGEEIYDLMPVVSMTFPWWEYLLYFMAIVAAAWLVSRIYRWLISEPVRERRHIQPDPEKMAFRAIKRLQLSPVWQNRQMKEICETLVFILKSFLLEKYHIGIGPAATSDEMLQTLVNGKAEPELRRRVNDLFDVCDRIKFMGERVEVPAEELVDRVAALIRDRGWQQ